LKTARKERRRGQAIVRFQADWMALRSRYGHADRQTLSGLNGICTDIVVIIRRGQVDASTGLSWMSKSKCLRCVVMSEIKFDESMRRSGRNC